MNSILNLVKVISYKNYVKFLKIENCHGGESDHMIILKHPPYVVDLFCHARTFFGHPPPPHPLMMISPTNNNK